MEKQENIVIEENPPRSKKRKVTVILSVLLGVAVLLCILVIGQVLSKGYVSLGGFSMFRVVTGSMEPTLPVGTVLIARDVPIETIQPGDIVTYRSRKPGMFNVIITHRAIAVHTGNDGKVYLETKGDANPYEDSDYVDEEYFVGKVVFYTGQNNVLAKVLGFITGRIGFLACIVLPCVLIGMAVMRDCIKSMRSEMEAITRELEENKQEEKQLTEPPMNQEEYEALRQRLREELAKELKQGAEQETTEQLPGAQCQ